MRKAQLSHESNPSSRCGAIDSENPLIVNDGAHYSWADPTSGVSFTYLTNYLQPDPWHSARLDRISNLAHAAID
jgi:hypothetical protein